LWLTNGRPQPVTCHLATLLLFSPAPAVYNPIMTTCTATTTDGRHCQRPSMKNSQYCYAHCGTPSSSLFAPSTDSNTPTLTCFNRPLQLKHEMPTLEKLAFLKIPGIVPFCAICVICSIRSSISPTTFLRTTLNCLHA